MLAERIFVILAITIGASLVMVILLAFYTVILRLRNMRKARQWQRMEARWRSVLLDMLAGVGSYEAMWRLVRPKENPFFVEYCLRFARRLRGVEAETLKRLSEPFLEDIAKRLARGDSSQRARAVRTLSTLGFERYSALIETALDDPSPLVAMIAAQALSQQGQPGSVAKVIDRLHRFRNWSQSYLASMLTSAGPDSAALYREVLLDGDKEARVRAVAADALRALNDLAAGDFAASVLKAETERDLVAATLRLLGEVGRPEHLSNVRRLCESDDFVIRAQALSVLGALGGSSDLEVLEHGLEDESTWTAIQAARGLKAAGGEQILQKLGASDHPRNGLALQVLSEGRAA